MAQFAAGDAARRQRDSTRPQRAASRRAPPAPCWRPTCVRSRGRWPGSRCRRAAGTSASSAEQAEQPPGQRRRPACCAGCRCRGSRAFQPAAAGVMSVGLVFVVAGYAWPDDGTVQRRERDERRPGGGRATRHGVAPLEVTPAGPGRPRGRRGASRSMAAAGADSRPTGRRPSDEPRGAGPGAAEDTGRRASRVAAGERAAEPRCVEEQAELERRERRRVARREPCRGRSSQGDDARTRSGRARRADARTRWPRRRGRCSEPDAAIAEDAAVTEVEPGALANDADVDGRTSAEPSAPERRPRPRIDDGSTPSRCSCVVGSALALAGGLLLLPGWLARRQRDPLLR